MECRYCKTWNEDDERRCVRCGRRLRVPSETRPVLTSSVPALQVSARVEPQVSAPAQTAIYQPSLFRDASGGTKVIPIPMHTQARSSMVPDAPPRRAARSSRPDPRRPPSSQQALEFHQDEYYDSYGRPGPDSGAADAGIYCDALVAPPAHRMIAAAMDASIVLIGVGAWLGVFLAAGGELILSPQNLPILLAACLILALFYRILWCLADGDSPGMRFAGLKLVDFDGNTPDRDQRGLRQVASLLSVISAGLGLVWALVDEENLTWHDHISKTFPTARS